ncbi:hypothetical protein PC41400_14740 [Paenibacillus chitinolyticus]|uniref:Uncharacterized protein n=1 Tax=Paenibacillus chitinolyticus TaxID=79263 RepID=A0A410WWJ5_9BACL|nr:hypothetical protein [Paenibacillus chitinolyticus]MCY9593970.1 hypothetical protein [Paenibacillus chitinolyticus]MCY9599625.1 hypothetical protein [Paenibacillus chitinolyticus]QAV18866.1 hypothetical protein PC41400_14740 [Paenibacillus chitinolyticus]
MNVDLSHFTVANIWSIFGLIMDLVGVIFLGFAFFSKSFDDLRKESGTFFNYNPSLFLNLLDQKASGVAGTVALSLGFLQQFIVNIPISTSIPSLVLVAVLLFFNILIVVGLLVCKKYYVLYQLAKIALFWDKGKFQDDVQVKGRAFQEMIIIGKVKMQEIQRR